MCYSISNQNGFILIKNNNSLKRYHYYLLNLMDTTAILELLNEQSSSCIFPEVKNYLQGKIQKFIFDPAQKVDFTQKVEVSGSHIHIPRNMDILYGMEITGCLQIEDVLYDKLEQIIQSIDLVIGGQNIATFYSFSNPIQI